VIFDQAVSSDDRGQLAGLIGTVLDVTASKQQERLLKLRAQRDEALLRLPQAADERLMIKLGELAVSTALDQLHGLRDQLHESILRLL